MMMDRAQVARSPWRWMVLCSRLFWTFICLGSFKSLGVFIPHFVDSFSTSTAVAGIVSSLVLGFGLFSTGPFVGALLKIWDARKLTIAGGALAGISMFAASFSSSMAQLGVWFAIMSIGLALIEVSSVKPLMDYFPDSFATANGVSLAGGTVGMMVIPPLVQRLVSFYGWRNAMGLLGAFSLNYIACGALLRPPPRTLAKYSKVPSQTDNGDAHTQTSGKRSEDQLSKSNADRENCTSVFCKVAEVLRDRFDTQLLGEPVFIIYQAVTVLNGILFSSWHLFLIPQGLELGYGTSASALLATFGGFGSLIGRLGHGTIVDRQLTKSSTLLILSALVFAAASIANPLALTSYAALAALATVSGVAIGAIYPLALVLMREITGDSHTSAYSWLFLSHGAGQIIGGFLSGWIHDATGAYAYIFLTLGGISVTMAAILLVTRCLLTCCETE